MNNTLQTEMYISLLAGEPDAKVTFAVVPEAPGMRDKAFHVHDIFENCEEKLRAYNDQGCGIFMAVNGMDFEGRCKDNVVSVRAVWVDLDHCATLPEFRLEPSVITRTKKGFHVYWVVDAEDAAGLSVNAAIKLCEGVNKRIVQAHGGDPKACDAARILRVPGFNHMKDGAHMVEMVDDPGYHYTWDELTAAYPPAIDENQYVDAEPTYCQNSSDYGRRAAQLERDELGAVPTGVGERNSALNRSAFKLGTLVASGHLTEESAYEAVMAGARANGYESDHGERTTRQQILSGLRAGMRKPRADAPERFELSGTNISGVAADISVAPPGGLLKKEGLLSRCQAEMDKRIKMGFNPSPGPLSSLNIVLGGGAPAGAATLLGAPPGMGKSSLALSWADSVAGRGVPALYISLELSELDLYSRLCTLQTEHNWLAVRCGKHNDKLFETIKRAEDKPFYSLTRHDVPKVEMIRVAIEEISQKYGTPPFVVIDYLQLLLDAMSQTDQRLQMGHISGELIHMADDLAAPIMCITAVNRQSYKLSEGGSAKPDRYLALAAAKESGKLEYDAEVIMALQLLEEVESGQYGWVCIAKNRSGGGSGNIPVRYDGRSGNFYDAEEDDVFSAIAAAKEGERKAKMKDIVEAVRENINDLNTASMDEVAKRLGLPRGKTREAIGQMVLDGRIERDFHGNMKWRG